jgi:hypothetical protein
LTTSTSRQSCSGGSRRGRGAPCHRHAVPDVRVQGHGEGEGQESPQHRKAGLRLQQRCGDDGAMLLPDTSDSQMVSTHRTTSKTRSPRKLDVVKITSRLAGKLSSVHRHQLVFMRHHASEIESNCCRAAAKVEVHGRGEAAANHPQADTDGMRSSKFATVATVLWI